MNRFRPDVNLVGIRTWTWLAVISSVGICAALTWYSIDQQRIVARTTELVGTIRNARVELARGFLRVSLARGEEASFDRSQGRTLVNQALAALQAAAAGDADQANDADEVRVAAATAERIAVFRAAMSEIDGAGVSADGETRRRIAYFALESQLDQLDQSSQLDLQRLETRLRGNFVMMLGVGGFLLLGVGVGMHLAGRAYSRSLADLRAAEGRLQAVVNNLAEGVLVTNQTGDLPRWNEAARKMHGIDGQDKLPSDLDTYRSKFAIATLDGEPLPLEQWPMVQALRGEKVRDVELRLRRHDGNWERTLRFNGASVRDGNNDELAFLSFSDITESKHAEERLHLFRSLLDQSRDGIEVIEPESGRFLDVNEAGCRELGYTREELLEMRVSDINPAVTPSLWAKHVARVRARGALSGKGRHRRKDGTEFPVEFNTAWVRLDREYLVAVVRDVTERVRAEQALRDSEARFRGLVEQSLVGMFVIEGARYLYVSPGYARIFGYDSPAEIIENAAVTDLVLPADRELVTENIRRRMAGEINELHYEFRGLRKDGTTVEIEVQGRAMEYEGRRAVVGVLLDVSQRKQLEEQFRHAQKMEAIGTLAGGIAHDFNNILAAILGFAGVARIEAEGNPSMIEVIDGILEGSRRATDLVRQILAFSRMQVQERQVLQLRHVVAEAAKLLRATIPTTIEFKSSLAADVPPVLADASQVHQVIMNLATNAAHAMADEPGRLDFVLEAVEAGPEFAATRLNLQPGRYTRLSITDTGCGMDSTVVSRIFEPFFTTKAPGEGTGLGLAVVHGIMERHNGAVSVYSTPGEGTRFDLYFPAHEVEELETAPASAEPAVGFGEHVMFVDDEEPLVRMGRRVLEHLGYEVESYQEPEAAWQAFQAAPEKYDLVVTDLTMPGMTGTELAARMLKLRPNIPIILATGFSATVTPEKVRAMGIRELLLKPFAVQSLSETVRRILTKEN